MKEGIESGMLKSETSEEPRLFHWREWVNDPDLMSEQVAGILDGLEGLINDDSDSDNTKFRKDVYDRGTKMQGNALLSLVGNLRSVISPEERKLVSAEIEKAETKIPWEYFD